MRTRAREQAGASANGPHSRSTPACRRMPAAGSGEDSAVSGGTGELPRQETCNHVASAPVTSTLLHEDLLFRHDCICMKGTRWVLTHKLALVSCSRVHFPAAPHGKCCFFYSEENSTTVPDRHCRQEHSLGSSSERSNWFTYQTLGE